MSHSLSTRRRPVAPRPSKDITEYARDLGQSAPKVSPERIAELTAPRPDFRAGESQ